MHFFSFMKKNRNSIFTQGPWFTCKQTSVIFIFIFENSRLMDPALLRALKTHDIHKVLWAQVFVM